MLYLTDINPHTLKLITGTKARALCNSIFATVEDSNYVPEEDRRFLGSHYFEIANAIRNFHSLDVEQQEVIVESEAAKELHTVIGQDNVAAFVTNLSPSSLALAAGIMALEDAVVVGSSQLFRKSLHLLTNFRQIGLVKDLMNVLVDPNPWMTLPPSLTMPERIEPVLTVGEGQSRLSGRVMSYRNHKKTSFADLMQQDATPRQVAIETSLLSELPLDLKAGDYLDVFGTMGVSRSGHPTFFAETVRQHIPSLAANRTDVHSGMEPRGGTSQDTRRITWNFSCRGLHYGAHTDFEQRFMREEMRAHSLLMRFHPVSLDT